MISSFSTSDFLMSKVLNCCAKFARGARICRSWCYPAAAMKKAKSRCSHLGADDYVTKPFGMEELLARMRAALRHQLPAHDDRPIFKLGDLSVDLVRRIVKMRDRQGKLSPKEYELLRLLVHHAGKVLTHKFLLRSFWIRRTTHNISVSMCDN